MSKVRFPSVADVASELRRVNKMRADNGFAGPSNDEGGIDVRLQVTDGGWQINAGLSDYDQDHRGYWGAASVPGNRKRFDSTSLARDLISQAKDQAADDSNETRGRARPVGYRCRGCGTVFKRKPGTCIVCSRRGAKNHTTGTARLLPVMFRMDKGKGPDRDVTAVFPTLPGTTDPSTMTVYAHVGQHGVGSIDWVQDRTRPATAAEYAPLLAELRSIYGRSSDGGPVGLKVVKRITRAMNDERRRAAR